MPFRPAVPSAVSSIADAAGRVMAVRLPDLVAPSAGGDSALVVAGSREIRTGEDAAFPKVVAVARRGAAGRSPRRRAARAVT